MKNKFIVGMSKVAIATVLSTAMVATPALASTGDLWKGSTDIGGVTQLLLKPDVFLDLLGNMSSYSYEVNGMGYDVNQSNDLFLQNPNSTPADVQTMITDQLHGTPLPVNQGLEVASVSAINSTQLKVTFNEAVNSTSAVKVANYALQNADGSTASSVYVGYAEIATGDPNSVILTLADSSSTPTKPATFTDLTKTYKVAVLNDISTSTATALTTPITGTVTVTDVSLPVVADVTAVGNSAVDVTFNKPILYKDATDFVIKDSTGATQGGTLTAAYKAGSDFKTVRVTTQAGNSLASGAYTIQVIGNNGTTDVHDPAGFVFATANQNFTVTTATTATQVSSITPISQTQIDVVFSAPVVFTDGTKASWSADGITFKAGDATVTKVSDTEYKVNFTTNVIPAGTVTVKIAGLTDFNGQSVVASSQSVTVTANAVAALSGSVTEKDDKNLVLNFTQPIDPATGATASTYVLTNSSGTAVTASTPILSNSNTTVTVPYAASLTPGTYTLTVTGLKDAIGNAVTVAPQTLNIKSTSTVDATTFTAVGAGTTIVVSYPVAMSTSGATSITNASNYQYASDGSTFADLPTGTTLAASSDSKSVTITLPSGTTLTAGTSKIQVGNTTNTGFNVVADVYGNIQSLATKQILVAADSAPTLAGQAPKITGANTIIVQPTVNLATVATSDFNYSLDGGTTWKTAANATLTTIGSTQYVQITTASTDTLSALTSIANIKVKTVSATGTKTALGTGIAVATSNAASSSTFAVSIGSVEIKDANKVEVYLAGKAASLTAADLKLYQNGALYTGTITTALIGNNANGSVYELSLGTAIDPTASVTLKTVTQDMIATMDQNGSYLTANTTGVTGSAALMADTLATSTLASALVVTGDTITITFNRTVDPNTVVSGWDGTGIKTVDAKADTTGKLTIAGVGTISGYDVSAADDFSTSTLQFTSGNVLQVTLNITGTVHTTMPAAHGLQLTLNSALQTTAGTAASTNDIVAN